MLLIRQMSLDQL